MKKILFSCAVVTLMAACNSQKFQDQRCYGLLLDSLTNLTKFRERVTCLETGACIMVNEYQVKIDSLQKIVDSLTIKPVNKWAVKHKPKHKKREMVAKVQKTAPKTVKTTSTATKEVKPKIAPFYYENNKQKYYYYDQNRKTYYAIDPVSGEKQYL